LPFHLGLLALDPAFKEYPKLADKQLSIIAVFATLGFTGSIVMFSLFSVMRNRISNAIDVKTDIADKATGNLDAPTAPLKKEEAISIKQDLGTADPTAK
jgi:hypothetical protein